MSLTDREVFIQALGQEWSKKLLFLQTILAVLLDKPISISSSEYSTGLREWQLVHRNVNGDSAVAVAVYW